MKSCKRCGAENAEQNLRCAQCGYELPAKRGKKAQAEPAAPGELAPPARSPWVVRVPVVGVVVLAACLALVWLTGAAKDTPAVPEVTAAPVVAETAAPLPTREAGQPPEQPQPEAAAETPVVDLAGREIPAGYDKNPFATTIWENKRPRQAHFLFAGELGGLESAMAQAEMFAAENGFTVRFVPTDEEGWAGQIDDAVLNEQLDVLFAVNDSEGVLEYKTVQLEEQNGVYVYPLDIVK